MTDWNALTTRGLAARYKGGTWDVLPGCDAPDGLAICQTYSSVLGALDTLLAAGYRAAAHSIPAPGLDGPYDLTTLMKFSAGGGLDVVLVRRMTPH